MFILFDPSTPVPNHNNTGSPAAAVTSHQIIKSVSNTTAYVPKNQQNYVIIDTSSV